MFTVCCVCCRICVFPIKGVLQERVVVGTLCFGILSDTGGFSPREMTPQGEQRVTGSRTACYPRVFFLWLSVFVLVLCWSKLSLDMHRDFSRVFSANLESTTPPDVQHVKKNERAEFHVVPQQLR